jgi:L-histidine Nalpha-methyltransferase
MTQPALSLDASPDFRYAFAADVRAGLSHTPQKELPSKYLYDEVGSALFEVITVLPEYGVTRAEESLLAKHAVEIVEHLPHDVIVAELGSGSGRKTRRILEALCKKRPTSYCPIEISRSALQLCRRELGDIERISIVGYERDYLAGLAEVSKQRAPDEPLLVLFLGSTIGNFGRLAATRFLREIRNMLAPGDALLLGTDLIKPTPVLVAAYDDSIGVTASFNLNLLARINRELDGDFRLDRFAHEARWNSMSSAVEMHLVSLEAQTAVVDGQSFDFEAGESIHTETSRKYDVRFLSALVESAGWYIEEMWTDARQSFGVFGLASLS